MPSQTFLWCVYESDHEITPETYQHTLQRVFERNHTIRNLRIEPILSEQPSRGATASVVGIPIALQNLTDTIRNNLFTLEVTVSLNIDSVALDRS